MRARGGRDFLRCRLFPSLRSRIRQVLNCSPTNKERGPDMPTAGCGNRARPDKHHGRINTTRAARPAGYAESLPTAGCGSPGSGARARRTAPGPRANGRCCARPGPGSRRLRVSWYGEPLSRHSEPDSDSSASHGRPRSPSLPSLSGYPRIARAESHCSVLGPGSSGPLSRPDHKG